MHHTFKYLQKVLFLFQMTVGLGSDLKAQLSVDGPICIIPGTSYHYIINADGQDSSTVNVCVTGGTLSSGDTCAVSGRHMNSVFVIWGDTGALRLEVESSSGTVTINVELSKALDGGRINDSDRVQLYDTSLSNYLVRCEVAKGGHCSPVYTYQWQRSEDGIVWLNVDEAKEKDLFFNGSITGYCLFRRVTTESGSGTVAYSDSGMVIVNSP